MSQIFTLRINVVKTVEMLPPSSPLIVSVVYKISLLKVGSGDQSQWVKFTPFREPTAAVTDITDNNCCKQYF
jgi:hypothetical protein